MDLAARAGPVIERLLKDEMTVAEVTGALTFWLLRDASAKEGFHMNPPPRGWGGLSERALGFVASDEVPPGYPADVPFLAGSASVVNPTAAGFSVLWMTCPNPLLGFCEILDQSRRDGWDGMRREDVPMATQEDRKADLRKAGRVRRVRLSITGGSGGWFLTLHDERKE